MSDAKLKQAIVSAGRELIEVHGWSLDYNDERQILETVFGIVLLKHLSPLIDNEAARKARIAALRAELAELERDPSRA